MPLLIPVSAHDSACHAVRTFVLHAYLLCAVTNCCIPARQQRLLGSTNFSTAVVVNVPGNFLNRPSFASHRSNPVLKFSRGSPLVDRVQKRTQLLRSFVRSLSKSNASFDFSASSWWNSQPACRSSQNKSFIAVVKALSKSRHRPDDLLFLELDVQCSTYDRRVDMRNLPHDRLALVGVEALCLRDDHGGWMQVDKPKHADCGCEGCSVCRGGSRSLTPTSKPSPACQNHSSY